MNFLCFVIEISTVVLDRGRVEMLRVHDNIVIRKDHLSLLHTGDKIKPKIVKIFKLVMRL
jgi:hypothetical protein